MLPFTFFQFFVLLSQLLAQLFFHLSLMFLLIIQLILKIVLQLHGFHKLIDINLKRQSAVFIEGLKEVVAKVPAIPCVYGRSLLLRRGAKMELVTIKALLPKSTRNSNATLW